MKRSIRAAYLSWTLGALTIVMSVLLTDAQAGDEVRPDEPVSTFVNQAIQKKLTAAKIPCSVVADDAEFLRRAYLDLTGRIPTVEQAVRFLDSKDANKRRKLVDELLASPNFGKHFANVWTNLIYSGDIDPPQNIKQADLTAWLATQFSANRSWDKIVQDLISAEGNSPQAIFTIINGDNGKPAANKLAGASAKLFLGVQLQCAECHNHPFAKWKQKEFWGMPPSMAGDPARQEASTPASRRPPAPSSGQERRLHRDARAGHDRDSEHRGKLVGATVKARYLEGSEPALPSGPLRPTLAKWMTAPENPFFAKAAVNRLWYQMFGRGLVHPVDDMHEANPCSHPNSWTSWPRSSRRPDSTSNISCA